MRERRQSHIYIGPTIPLIGLKKFTLYRVEDPPESLQRHAEALPVLRSLYVPTSQLAVAAAKLSQPGTAEYVAHGKMQEIGKTILR